MQIRRRIALESGAPVRLFFVLLVSVIAFDQLVKYAVRASLDPGDTIPILQDILHVTYVRNTGAAFGLMPGNRLLFVTTGVLVTVGVFGFMWRMRPRSTWLVTSLALIAAGAVGNLVDRIVLGRVTDFLDVLAELFPVFNIADSAIVVGTAMLIVWVLFGPEPGQVEGESPVEEHDLVADPTDAIRTPESD